MRTIVFANPNSIHTRMNIGEIMLSRYERIVLAVAEDVKADNLDFYKKNNIEIVSYAYYHPVKAVRILKMLLSVVKIRSLGRFDACFVHYLNPTLCNFVAHCGNKLGRIVAVFWGSDLLRINQKKDLDYQRNLLDKADYIRAGELYSVEVFKQKFGNKYDDKLVQLDFLVNDYFKNEITKSRVEICREFSFDSDKIIVVCGYNGSKCQNHFKLITQIENLPQTVKNKCQFVFLMTYSDMLADDSQKYQAEIETLLSKINVDFCILKKFLTKPQMLELSNVTDIFLHFITTDSFSGTFIEMLAGGAYIIKGEWLKYYEFANCIYKDSNFDSLSADLVGAIDDIDYLKKQTIKNREIVLDLIDNTKFISQWWAFIKKLEKGDKDA